MERGWRRVGGENMGIAPLPKNSWKESGKLETATGTKLKREKGERRKEKGERRKEKGERRKEKGERRKEKGEGLNSIKTVNKGSTESETPQYNTWQCSGGKGECPRTQWGPKGSQTTRGKAVPLLEGHLVETVEATWSQQTLEGSHICSCWGKVVEGEAWCQMCVAIFHGP